MTTKEIHVVRCYFQSTGDLMGTRFDNECGVPFTAAQAEAFAAKENERMERRRKLKKPGSGWIFSAYSFEPAKERVA